MPPKKSKKALVQELEEKYGSIDDVAVHPPDMDNIEQIEWVSEVMTLFVHAINPLIDKGTTFEIMLQVMYEGLDAKNAVKWGEAIRATQSTPRNRNNSTTH